MELYTGTSGFGYKEWKGNFYPEKISPKKMLPYYAARLGAVEINNTFYRMPTGSVVKSWADQVPEKFLFAIKAPQVITHIKRLQNVREETHFFLTAVSVLSGKLGCVLFQFPAGFHRDIDALKNFIGLIPDGIPCAFDFRSPSWRDPEVLDLLGKRKFCQGIEDTDENPVDAVTSTAPWGYFRLRRENYTGADLKKWADRILAQKWERVFVFFKHEDDMAAKGPYFAESFRKLF